MEAEEKVRVFQYGQDIVRVHGEPNMDRIRRATEKFMREVERQRYEQQKKNNNRTATSA